MHWHRCVTVSVLLAEGLVGRFAQQKKLQNQQKGVPFKYKKGVRLELIPENVQLIHFYRALRNCKRHKDGAKKNVERG